MLKRYFCGTQLTYHSALENTLNEPSFIPEHQKHQSVTEMLHSLHPPKHFHSLSLLLKRLFNKYLQYSVRNKKLNMIDRYLNSSEYIGNSNSNTLAHKKFYFLS